MADRSASASIRQILVGAGTRGGTVELCAEAGLVQVGVIAVDGSKLAANASEQCNMDYEQIARAVLLEAAEIDAREDAQFGQARGDELPREPSTRDGRQAALAAARRRLEQRRAEQARPIAKGRPERLVDAKRRLEEQHRVQGAANEDYEASCASGRDRLGRRLSPACTPKPFTPPDQAQGKVNTTDPDSRNVKTARGWVQGHNAQVVCTEQQIIIAADVTNSSADFGLLEPMITAARTELAHAGVTQPLDVVLADAGYWHEHQIEMLHAGGLRALVAPQARNRKIPRRGTDKGWLGFMRRVLDSPAAHEFYRRRSAMIEPVFGHTKFNLRMDRFLRRGRAACRSEWRLMAATHNLIKLHNHRRALAA